MSFTDSPRSLLRLYIDFIAYERTVSDGPLPSTSSTDTQALLLGLDVALGPLTCDYAARLHLYSSHVLIPMGLCIAPLPVARGPLASLRNRSWVL